VGGAHKYGKTLSWGGEKKKKTAAKLVENEGVVCKKDGKTALGAGLVLRGRIFRLGGQEKI